MTARVMAPHGTAIYELQTQWEQADKEYNEFYEKAISDAPRSTLSQSDYERLATLRSSIDSVLAEALRLPIKSNADAAALLRMSAHHAGVDVEDDEGLGAAGLRHLLAHLEHGSR